MHGNTDMQFVPKPGKSPPGMLDGPGVQKQGALSLTSRAFDATGASGPAMGVKQGNQTQVSGR